ncbi:MAG: hypothetical protein QG670_879 [Thermoproteota archaeon]|nr:hypothetical protein [Thermoproteota archaeon]
MYLLEDLIEILMSDLGKVVIHVTMSLDGFIAGLHTEMNWVFKYGSDKMVNEVINEIGAIVLDKWTFNISLEKNQFPYRCMLKIPQFVITKEAQEPRTIGGLQFTFVIVGVENAVSQAKAATGYKNVALQGASID